MKFSANNHITLKIKSDFFVNRNPGSIVGGTNIITPRIFVNKKI